jgi:DNA-binding PadR family transcriptional regulator
MPPTRLSFADSPLPAPAFLILVSLADGAAHGYQIRKDLIDRSSGSINLDPGSLYRLIFRLHHDGLIDDVGGDEARRRSYRLTSQGKRVLKAETERMAGLVAQARSVGAARTRKA